MAIAVAIVQAPSLSIACKSGIDHPAAVCAVARRLPHLTGYTHHDLRLRLRFLPADLVEHAIIRLHAEFVAAHQRFERGRKGGAA